MHHSKIIFFLNQIGALKKRPNLSTLPLKPVPIVFVSLTSRLPFFSSRAHPTTSLSHPVHLPSSLYDFPYSHWPHHCPSSPSSSTNHLLPPHAHPPQPPQYAKKYIVPGALTQTLQDWTQGTGCLRTRFHTFNTNIRFLLLMNSVVLIDRRVQCKPRSFVLIQKHGQYAMSCFFNNSQESHADGGSGKVLRRLLPFLFFFKPHLCCQ